MGLVTGAEITRTPLTANGSEWKQIAVNTAINAGVGALLARHVCNQTYQQGAFLGATVTLAQATIGAWAKDAIPLPHHRYGQTIGLLAATFGLTYLKQANLPDFRLNVIHAATIAFFTGAITQAISDIFGKKI